MIHPKYFRVALIACLIMSLFVHKGPEGFSEDKTSSRRGWKVLLDGGSLKGWHPLDATKPNDWQTCGSVMLNREDNRFFLIGRGKGIVVNGEKGKTVNLVSDSNHGDIEAHIEFIVPKGSNSGIYFMGLYEIQVLDSYGKTDLAFSDCGGIYARWIDQKSVGGAAPRVNASKPPGQWQRFDVQFRAPRFDANGKKIENARFLRVIHNGTIIHQNVELDGPTRSAMDVPESSEGPLMLQGDHGPVAYRNILVRPLYEGRLATKSRPSQRKGANVE